MRIVFDLQACQTSSSRNRGIGRYSHALMKAIASRPRNHDIWLLLNDRFESTLDLLRSDFSGLVDPKQIVAFHGPKGVAHNLVSNSWRIHAAETLRNHFLAELKPDIVHTASVAEGLDEDAVIGPNSPAFGSAATIYDLIPHTYSEVYLQSEVTRNWYYRRLQQLKSTQTLLAISEFTRQDAIERLHLRDGDIFNISAGVDPSFKKLDLPAAVQADLRVKYGLDRAFVMYTGGVDFRKNLEGLIRAYGDLPRDLQAGRQLAIVCSMSPAEKAQLLAVGRSVGLTDHDLILTGYVPHDDLVALYNMCELFVFPSFSEGFGLPVLEAMACGAAVLGSNGSSIPEVIGYDDALFDPRKPHTVTAKIEKALTDPSFHRALRDHAGRQHVQFTWARSADRVLDALENTSRPSKTGTSFERQIQKPKLAYVSPALPAKSGIATYSSELLPDLAQHYDIELVVDQSDVTDPWLVANFPCHTPKWFADHAHRFDRIVYQMGNSSFHAYMFELIDRFPGVVVLHDFYLSGVAGWMDETGLRPGFRSAQMFRSHGLKPLLEDHAVMKYPANKPVLDSSLGLIVHSQHSVALSQYWYHDHCDPHWRVVPQVRVPYPASARPEAKRALGFADDAFLICCFGILDMTKHNELLLNAFIASQLAKNDKCHLVMVGESSGAPYLAALQAIAHASIAADRISFTGFVDDAKFTLYLKAADIAVQLRQMSRGETSRTALDAMSAGVPLIVNACGSMSELPGDCVVKLDEHPSVQELQLAIEMLWLDGAQRNKRISLARNWIRDRHHPHVVAQDYRNAIEGFYSDGIKRRRLGLFAQLINATSASASEADIAEIASVVAHEDGRDRPTRRVILDLTHVDEASVTAEDAAFLKAVLAEVDPTTRIEPITLQNGELHLAASGIVSKITGHAIDIAPYVINLTSNDTVILVNPPLATDAQGAGRSKIAPPDDADSGYGSAHLTVLTTNDSAEPGAIAQLLDCHPALRQIVCADEACARLVRAQLDGLETHVTVRFLNPAGNTLISITA